jgi:hypothetical protein
LDALSRAAAGGPGRYAASVAAVKTPRTAAPPGIEINN